MAGRKPHHCSATPNLDVHHIQRAPGPCRGQKVRTSLGDALISCAVLQGTTLNKRHHWLFQPHPPSFSASLGAVHAQPTSPCPSNAGGTPVPNFTTALPLPGHVPVDPEPWMDFPARPQTCLVVPGLCPTLLLSSPDPIPTSDLPHHHHLPRAFGCWADPSCCPRAHPAHFAWRQ